MKKKLLILAVAGLALASCSNDETVATQVNRGANEISFRTNVNGVTRAADIDAGDGTNGLKTIGFYVTAAYTTATPTLYFNDEHYMLASSDPSDVWKPTDDNGSTWKIIYWPEGSDVLDFHAYAPATGTQLSVSNTNIGTLNGCPEYTVTPAATTDATSANTQIDFVYATLTNKDQADGSMNLAFNHKESKISINLKNTDAALTITVSEVALCNITQSGVFKNRNATDATINTTMEWGDFGALTTYYQTLASPIAYTTPAAQAGSSWILIPHTLDKPTTDGQYVSETTGAAYDGAYIRVKMKVQSTTNPTIYYAGDADNYVSAIWPISTNASATTWLAGTHYTYTVDLAGGGYYETNQATPSGATLDRVLNLHEITFATVTVTGWGTSDSDVAFP